MTPRVGVRLGATQQIGFVGPFDEAAVYLLVHVEIMASSAGPLLATGALVARP